MLLVEQTLHLLVPDDHRGGTGVGGILLHLFYGFEQLGLGVEPVASDKIVDNLPELIILAEEEESFALGGGGNMIGNEDNPSLDTLNLIIRPDDIPVGTLDLVGQTRGSEKVLHGVGLQPRYLHPAALDQLLEHKIHRTQRHARMLRKLPLRRLGMCVDIMEDAEL